jgi:ribose 5-phosphate isomerase A
LEPKAHACGQFIEETTMSDLAAQKKAAAKKALDYITPGTVVGVGSGSTVNAFVDALGEAGIKVEGYVAASIASETRLRGLGLRVLDMNEVQHVPVYVDGADEIDPLFRMIKGGGAALTREKIIASAADIFVCIVDSTKTKDRLGGFPLAVEVVPFARTYVDGVLRKRIGGEPKLRAGVTTDNGNQILDVTGYRIDDPDATEADLNNTPGVVECGIFARRRADILLIGGPDGVTVRKPPGK